MRKYGFDEMQILYDLGLLGHYEVEENTDVEQENSTELEEVDQE